jgi:hypothetical protein
MTSIVRDWRVVEFLLPRVGGVFNPDRCKVVGLEHDGVIRAGALYERCNGHNVFFHGASDGSRRWATRPFIKALMHLPFVELDVPRMTTVVAESNTNALLFDYHLGFEEEQRLARAAHDGTDSIYLVMWKEQCKWLDF